MNSKSNPIEYVLKSSELSDDEKEKILFEAFDVLLSEEDVNKTEEV